MPIQRQHIAMISAMLGLVLVIAAVSTANAEEQPGFTPTYRLWPRITSGYVASNQPFNNKTSNRAGLDLTGLHTVYANTKALGWILGGKKGLHLTPESLWPSSTSKGLFPGIQQRIVDPALPADLCQAFSPRSTSCPISNLNSAV